MTDNFLLYKCGVQNIEVACQLYASGYFFNFVLFEFLLDSVIYLMLICTPFLAARLLHKYLHFIGNYLWCIRLECNKTKILTEMLCMALMLIGVGIIFFWITIPVTLLTAELLTSPAEVEGLVELVKTWTQSEFERLLKLAKY